VSNQPKYSAVLFAKNPHQVAKFYEELLSMNIIATDADHIVLDAPGFQLVVHGIPPQVAESIDITIPPTRRTAVPTKLCFPVDSIAEARAKAVPLGGALNPKSQEWESRVFRACDGHDPEGNIVQFRESL
jgi:Glyoxalase-like domain